LIKTRKSGKKDVMAWLSTFFRIFALLVVIPLLYITYLFSPLNSRGDQLFGPALSIAFALLSLLCIWFSIRGQMHRDRVLLLWGIVSGIVTGWVGLVVGVFGAIWLWPESNLAPILGFFVTGPYSFVGGVFLGILAGTFVMRKKSKANSGE
jgi:hypothetical protein